MNFQGLKPIDDSKFYLDLAFRKADERASIYRGGKNLRGTRLEKSVKVESLKVDIIKDTISDRLLGTLKAFPDTESLPEFYQELLKCTVDYTALKKSLGSLNWARKKVGEMHKIYSRKIRACKDLNKINVYRREFYGRISSIINQIKNNFKFLEMTRRAMRQYPAIKTGMKTVAIAGFPNVGKTTLLAKLTGSKPDIQPYAFTTKGINVGYIKGKEKIQLLDTPGTLNRFEKMNNIEKVAYLVLKMLAEKIIYVFDATEPYPMEEQEKLFKSIKQLKKPTVIYLSKTDIIGKEEIKEFSETHKFLSVDEIKKLFL